MAIAKAVWEPPAELTRGEIVQASDEMLAQTDIPVSEHDVEFRLELLGLPWDIGGKVIEPARVASGADGKKVGMFLLHGGSGDHRGKEQMARFIAAKLGWKVVLMTYPGRFNFADPKRDWPGDTINTDGTVRTPLWQKDRPATPDQYELIEDRSDPDKRAKWGTLFFLKAREGSEFYERMAGWPVAFEEAMLHICRTELPETEWTIYLHGHSTGGPFVHLLLQRLENIGGLVGMESSPYGEIYGRMLGMTWNFPFSYLTLRTWRHIAKYSGAEAGPEGAWRLPWIMEDVLEAWERQRKQPQFKAEYIVTYGAYDALGEAARHTAKRCGLNEAELIARYHGYARPLGGAGVRPVPPLLYGITAGSRDHTLQRYEDIVLPAAAAFDPPAKARVVRFQAGVHGYEKEEEGLPEGVVPAILRLWRDAVNEGYYA